MTVTSSSDPGTEVAAVEMITVTVDGVMIEVPKGTLAIRAAELLGVEIPRFCDHPLLDPVAACRACLVDIEGMPKPQPACAQVLTEGMVVRTQMTSPIAREAQEGVMEFLLLNHPLDCPVCDKGGECPLQNQAMQVGRPESRFEGEKRLFDKPINVSAQILLDRERCVSCARCTRFADEIAGDPMLELLERGAHQQVGTAEDQPFDSYFSGNVVQICPVGALTSASYRFRSRPFDLVSVPTACEHCASGCGLRTDYRRGTVTRRLAWETPEVNEDWNCDKGRFAFAYLTSGRITTPLVREAGELRVASWPEALDAAARGLAAAGSSSAALVGGRLTVEDAYAYARFLRIALGSDHIDFRSRDASDEEAAFLRAAIAGTPVSASYESIERAPIVLTIALEPEDESPIVFLRLRKAARKRGTRVVSIGAISTPGLHKVGGERIDATPGAEAAAIAALPADVRAALGQRGAVILVGERVAGAPGGPGAVLELARSTGAALAWVPRRAGERSALDAGALAGLLPGGRPLDDQSAREQIAAVWGIEPTRLPAPGASGDRLLQLAADGSLRALLVGGIDPVDHPDPDLVRAGLANTEFVVSLATHHSEVTEAADVVLPVAVVTEKAGTFLDWEGRPRPFTKVLRESLAQSDASVLGMVAESMGVPVGPSDVPGIRSELGRLGAWTGTRAAAPPASASAPTSTGPASDAGIRLVAWRALIDSGVMQQGEPYLAATARPVVARVSAATAAGLGSPAEVRIGGPKGSITLPLVVDDVMDGVIAVPMHSEGCWIYRDLGVRNGAVVTVGGAA